jgi:hypothetical protein
MQVIVGIPTNLGDAMLRGMELGDHASGLKLRTTKSPTDRH